MYMRQTSKPVYLDVCALGRPYDDQRYPRIAMETLGVVMITTLIKTGIYRLYYSPVHLDELSRNTNDAERMEIIKLLHGYGNDIAKVVDDYAVLEKRARDLIKQSRMGFSDSLHVANAEALDAAFITCDDILLRKCKNSRVTVWYGTPIDYCIKEGLL